MGNDFANPGSLLSDHGEAATHKFPCLASRGSMLVAKRTLPPRPTHAGVDHPSSSGFASGFRLEQVVPSPPERVRPTFPAGTDSSSSVKQRYRTWTPEEDVLLLEAVEKSGDRNWARIAEAVGSKNKTQCLQRWRRVLSGPKKGRWGADEDALLVSLVGSGFDNWGQLAQRLPGRTAKQCRERWKHRLDPAIKKGRFSAAEDAAILAAQVEVGNRWAVIARRVPGRTENHVRIRW
ncbi:unnamed protein product, partial [Phaeothamnion confervicola]